MRQEGLLGVRTVKDSSRITGSTAALELDAGAEYPVLSQTRSGVQYKIEPMDSLGCRLYDFRVEFSLCSCSPNAWGPNVLGQIAQLSVLLLGSMPAPVAMRGFCVTHTGSDRRTDLARNLFLKNSRFKAIPSMLSLSIACLQC